MAGDYGITGDGRAQERTLDPFFDLVDEGREECDHVVIGSPEPGRRKRLYSFG